jgi:chromate transporter
MSTSSSGSIRETFIAFLRLGLGSFGGPVAHLGYFRSELVVKRAWISETVFSRLIAWCQFLPGPTSSQVGFLIGWQRNGWPGAIAAWLGFTLPAMIMMTAAAWCWKGPVGSAAWFHGVKIAVLAVVAQAVRGMAASLCPDASRLAIAGMSGALVLVLPGLWAQMLALMAAAISGLLLRLDLPIGGNDTSLRLPSRRSLIWCGCILAMAGVLALNAATPLGRTVAACWQTGCLVFGGGHVVLPLLQPALVDGGLISSDRFLAGYALAQVVPGPMFSVAAFLGAGTEPSQNVLAALAGAVLATIAIFLPGLLLAVGGLGLWGRLERLPRMRRGMAGLCAGTVGLLAAACYDPVGTSAIHGRADAALALTAFAVLSLPRVPVWTVVAGCAGMTAAAG